MNKKQLLLLLLIAFCAYTAYPQFTIKAEIRDRAEIRDGYRSLAESDAVPAALIWQRSRISFLYSTDKLRLVFTPQDVRLWGSESISSSTGVFGDEASLEVTEAYAEIKVFDIGWISTGRQSLKYDNQRLLAARNWNNYGMSYDALLLKLQRYNWNLHLGTTWNSMTETVSDNLYPGNRIKNLNFIWINGQVTQPVSFSFLHISSGITESDSVARLHYKHTCGIYMEYKNDKLQMWGEAYYQGGKTNSGLDIRAYMFALETAYKPGILSPGIGMCHLSGNQNIENQDKEHLFDILYGARHRFYGYMDYFRNLPAHTAGGGLVNVYFSLNMKLSGKCTLVNTTHYFQLAQINSLTPPAKHLGFENDLVMKYRICPTGLLELGYMAYCPSPTLIEIQGVENSAFAHFTYLQLTLTPELFIHETGQK